MIQPSNRDFEPPLPDSMLLNDGKSQDYNFAKDKTYRFRIINFAALTSFMINFQSHKMTVIMNDASYINSEVVDMLRIAPGQRYDVLIKGSESDNQNYPFLIGMDENADYTDPNTTHIWNKNETGYLVMDPNGERGIDVVNAWLPADDSKWEPYQKEVALPPADKVFQLDFSWCFDQNNVPRYFTLYRMQISVDVNADHRPGPASTTTWETPAPTYMQRCQRYIRLPQPVPPTIREWYTVMFILSLSATETL
jgi:iron transport multicopper oxidase